MAKDVCRAVALELLSCWSVKGVPWAGSEGRLLQGHREKYGSDKQYRAKMAAVSLPTRLSLSAHFW
jgi:hypothetical protein